MQESVHIFPYTAQRGIYLSTAIVLMFLTLVEAIGLVPIIFSLIHIALLQYGLSIFLILLCFSLLIYALLPPLWTKHRLTPTQLQLHYGFALNVTLPRLAIISAEPVRERLSMLQPVKAQYNVKKRRIIAAFSEQGQLLLRLDKAYPLKLGRETHLTDSLLINVDRRDELLALLV